MKRVILLRGLPASGKSTWAREMIDKHPGQYKRVNKDELRFMIDNDRWSDFNEKMILNIRDQIILEGLNKGCHIICDDTNLSDKHYKRIKQLIKDNGLAGKVKIEYKDFTDVPVHECIKRDLKRTRSVGEKVIKQMYNRYLKPKPVVLKQDKNLPECYIFDIDGTLAIHNGRGPYEEEKCETDLLNKSVYSVYFKLVTSIRTPIIILVSGRRNKVRKQTEKWLRENNIDYDSLYMRRSNDKRKDYIVKEEIFNKYIKDKYKVIAVFDDRNQTVNHWREMGLTCLQVAEGDF